MTPGGLGWQDQSVRGRKAEDQLKRILGPYSQSMTGLMNEWIQKEEEKVWKTIRVVSPSPNQANIFQGEVTLVSHRTDAQVQGTPGGYCHPSQSQQSPGACGLKGWVPVSSRRPERQYTGGRPSWKRPTAALPNPSPGLGMYPRWLYGKALGRG